MYVHGIFFLNHLEKIVKKESAGGSVRKQRKNRVKISKKSTENVVPNQVLL